MKLINPAQPSKDSNKTVVPERYEIEDAARTLTKAEEIKNNKNLMPHVHKHLQKSMKHIASSVADLKAMSKRMNDKEEAGETPMEESKE